MSQIDFERGVALSIDIKIADHCQLIFKNATKELKVESKFSRYQLKAERDALRQGLDEFQSGFAALRRRPLPEVGKALGLLHLLGRKILYRLFDDKEKLNEAQQMCWDACPNRRQPGWEQPGRDPASLPPHVIEVRTAVDHGIPIDLLPLLDPMKPRPVETMDDLARTAGTLLGFSSIVRRTLVDTLPDERRLRIENMDSLPLKMFWDGNLPGAQSAKKFFEENSAHFDTKGGPWPNGTESSDENTFCETVATYLGDPESSFDGEAGHQSDQLCYFFCHCDTSATNPDDYLLYLGRGGWRKRHKVKLESLEDELWQRNLHNSERGRKRGPGPLVFLNACGSAILDPAAAISFPKLFLQKNMGFLGFIGTEAKVSDVFGSTFAEVFYRRFLGGLQLGRALHAARWHMLREHLSPLGILYTLYADPEIEVRKKIGSLCGKSLD